MKIEMCDEFFYKVENEDIFNLLNTSKENVLRNNNNIKFYHGEWVKVKQNDYHVHIVKPMETISSVSNQYNILVDDLIKDNKLKTEKLFIGQTLKICNKKTKKPTN